jgi:succinate-semialdehyde dehydrogenase/glutarate-semialdehyde dehydrogenase
MKLTSTNPSRNCEIIGEVEVSTEQDIQNALNKAREAQPHWAALSQAERNKAIESFITVSNEHAEEIATAISTEMGKPIKESRLDIQDSANHFHAFMKIAEQALKPETVFEDETQKHIQIREPLGVLAAITPWNFPFFNIAFQFGPALLAGNTVLYKPSEEIVVFAKLVERLVKESEIPEDVLTVLYGDGKVGEQLVQLPVDGILFTGSTRTGQRITELAAKRSTPVMTEMGGSSPGIIFKDADIDAIIDTVYEMRVSNTGQYCDGLKRLLVHESKLDAVLNGLKQVNATKKVGDALAEDIDFGPLVAKRQLDLLKEQVADALSKGAHILFGGKEPEGLKGAYYEPTVLTNITFDMRVWKEEVFGPVLPVVTFKTEEEAVKLANDTSYGLSAYVFTTNKDTYHRVASKLKAGAIAHNNSLYFSPFSPFGGYKGSGNSRVCGVEGFHEVTQVKLISEEK